MRKHATEHVIGPTVTLCGEPIANRSINNNDPDCKRCLRVIRSRCFKHNVKRCKVCTYNIMGGNQC